MKRNLYETQTYLNEYLFFHYGKPKDFCPYPFAPNVALDFQRRVVEKCLLPVHYRSPTRGLDVGCGVGRSTFELARLVDRALGIDNSKNFIRAAKRMARARSIQIRVKEEGDRFASRTVTLPKHLPKGSVSFRVADAQKLSRVPGRPFHVVLAINLIDRLPNPRKFLSQLPGLVVPGGQLLIASPYTWMKEYTPRNEWLSRGGQSATQALDSTLKPHFKLARRRDLPFLIREHRRKYQWCVSEVSTYIRRAE